MKDLCEFLEAAELQQYLTSFQDKLKVTTIDQIKYVDDEDLAGIGMSKPEIRRLRQFFVKERPQSALDKLRKVGFFLYICRYYCCIASYSVALSPSLNLKCLGFNINSCSTSLYQSTGKQ